MPRRRDIFGVPLPDYNKVPEITPSAPTKPSPARSTVSTAGSGDPHSAAAKKQSAPKKKS